MSKNKFFSNSLNAPLDRDLERDLNEVQETAEDGLNKEHVKDIFIALHAHPKFANEHWQSVLRISAEITKSINEL